MSVSDKRARVMRRSQQLGHCICDPRKPCPCDLFIAKNVCTCAGERLEDAASDAPLPALTRLVKNAGCASKIPPAELARVLSQLPPVEDPRLLVGLATADDAGVFQVRPDLCLVQTVDVFAPCVDDPYLFGQIAACNSLSDCYAMGGTPLTALSIISYPIHTLPANAMTAMLRGGMDKLAEAGVTLVGGHSLNGEEIFFGFAVTGVVQPNAVVTNAGARPGDVLILTKKIGTGIVSFAAQVGRAAPGALAEIGASMSALNRAAADVMVRAGAHAATDVTGFGLLGHLYNVVRESKVTAEIWWDAVPLFTGVLDLAAAAVVGGAAERNREYAGHAVVPAEDVPPHAMDVLYDAQTSGGLLIAVPRNRAEETLDMLRRAGCREAAIVGAVTGSSEGKIVVTHKDASPNVSSSAAPDSEACCGGAAPPRAPECCAPGAGAVRPGDAAAAFADFTAKVMTPGALDVVQKVLAAIALSVAVQCEPCLNIYLDKAQAMRLSAEEIEEAAMMGVMFGGCRAMMFWKQHKPASAPPAAQA